MGALEKRHDSYMEDNPLASPLMDAEGEIPSADEIAEQLQEFLSHHHESLPSPIVEDALPDEPQDNTEG